MNVRNIYRVSRAVVMTVVITVVSVYLLLYLALSIPLIQNEIKGVAEKELSKFFGTDVTVSSLEIYPFSRVVAEGVDIPDPEGREAVSIDRLGAGVDIWRLISKKELVFTHAEIIGLDGKVTQARKNGPLNIDFIIKAFKPKQKNKPPTKFDFKIHNIIIRQSRLSFDRLWQPRKKSAGIDFNHVAIKDLRADIRLPRMKNDDFNIDIRRLAMSEKSGLEINELKGIFHISPTMLSVRNLFLELPGTLIHPNDISLRIKGYDDIKNALLNSDHHLVLNSAKVTLSDFRAFLPALSRFNEPLFLNLDVEGNMNVVTVRNLAVKSPRRILEVETRGEILHLGDIKNLSATLPLLKLTARRQQISDALALLPSLSVKARDIITRLGDVELDAKLMVSLRKINAIGKIFTSLGKIDMDAVVSFPASGQLTVNGKASTPGFELGTLLAQTSLGSAAFSADTDMRLNGRVLSGSLTAEIPYFDYNGKRWNDIRTDITKSGDLISGEFSVADPDAMISGSGEMNLADFKSLNARIDIDHINTGVLSKSASLRDLVLHGNVIANLAGSNINNAGGLLSVTDFYIDKNARHLDIGDVTLEVTNSETKNISLSSRYLDGNVTGRFKLTDFPGLVRAIVSAAFPDIFGTKDRWNDASADFNFTIKNDNTLTEYFNLPIRLLTEIPVRGSISGAEKRADLSIDIPYLQQGKDKLIQDTRLDVAVDGTTDSYTVAATSLVPVKNGETRVNLRASARDNRLLTDIDWNPSGKKAYDGSLRLSTLLSRNSRTGRVDADISILPSQFRINDTIWNINPAAIHFADRNLLIDRLLIDNRNQHIDIHGAASSVPGDSLFINLKNIDLDYIFQTLNINYVTFGGRATGKVSGTGLFTKTPVAFTDALRVENLSYNDARLGDAVLKSRWDNGEKAVRIFADIADEGHRAAIVDGAVYVTRDSLGFSLDADKVNVKFLKPFMQAFSSDVEGRASGHANLYGTFSDIDLTGRIFADTIRMKVDYTNTWYGGSDSVVLNPGHIVIPNFTLYDKFGKSAMMRGEVTHRYFHEPAFNFRLFNARDLLCYDTNVAINPDWYGTIFGSGGASITGYPGFVDILVEMTTSPGSVFTFVLNDLESAVNYKFLTFTDRRKSLAEAARPDTVPDIVKRFRKKIAATQEGERSAFNINLRASVNNNAQAVIVMDPVGGDKIKARGNGALQIDYSSTTDRMSMYGKYTLDEGAYNFTLQDIILRDFTIRPGSFISFNGDPLNAVLGINAVYKVNTNLSDLDKSFSQERDLNRTSVPVEVDLNVSGQMQNPEIKFDIELPTLTQDVARKVKSIISTEDMMNRQIIYLLALNRFYTPEYMSTQGNGGEFTSLASSTISGQISNLLSNLTDKWRISPYFRSDNGDFSDLEMDLNLSSNLFNNRLIFNGNLGYRDKATSSTTFIGDFDLEYLLNRRGNFRLKAYNHFNDKNYYLKSALTTQGIGVIFKIDFDNWFSFLRKFRHSKSNGQEKGDSLKK